MSKPISPFSFTDDISYKKENLLEKLKDDPKPLKEYKSFLINRQFSYFVDTILYANEMNIRYEMDCDMQFDYLFHSIRPRKRYTKWAKMEKVKDIAIIQEYYGYSLEKAKLAILILTKKDIKKIADSMEKGGRK